MPTILKAQIQSHIPQLLAAAQKVYDNWDQDEGGWDEELGEGGICDLISSAFQGVLCAIPDVNIRSGGHDGDEHAYTVIYNATEAYEVDIPPCVYEFGGGLCWTKREGVQFTNEHLIIGELKASDFQGEDYND